MKTVDMRFDKKCLAELLGQEFLKYRCDRFDYTNSVTGNVGLFIGNKVFLLTNCQQAVDYYGENEDMAVFRMDETEAEKVKSFFEDVEQIDTPVKNKIKSIRLVNEHQQLFIGEECQYDVWLTRAVVFSLGDNEVSFTKDAVPFSEEIIIKRGYKLIDEITPEADFMEGWDGEYSPKCSCEIVVIE